MLGFSLKRKTNPSVFEYKNQAGMRDQFTKQELQ